MAPKRDPKNSTSLRIGKNGKPYYAISSPNKFLQEKGREIVEAYEKETGQPMGLKSKKLHLVRPLVVDSIKTTTKRMGVSSRGPTIVGVTLISDIEITVPVIDPCLTRKPTKDTKVFLDPIGDVQWRTQPANEMFNLTMYELMFLIMEPEYNGYLTYNKEEFSARLSYIVKDVFQSIGSEYVRITKDGEPNKVLMPTPTLRLLMGRLVRETDPIDQQINGEWVCKEGYERFQPLLPKKKSTYKKGQRTVAKENVKKRVKKEPTEVREGRNSSLTQKPVSQVTPTNQKQATSPAYTSDEEMAYTFIALYPILYEGKFIKTDLVTDGYKMWVAMEELQKNQHGSKAETLHFNKKLLINKTTGIGTKDVGVKLTTDCDISIPQINGFVDTSKRSIDIKTDIEYVNVLAGSSFDMTFIELLYLIARPEYAGFITFKGEKVNILELVSLPGGNKMLSLSIKGTINKRAVDCQIVPNRELADKYFYTY